MKKVAKKLSKKVKIFIGVFLSVFVIMPNIIIFNEVEKFNDSNYGRTKFTNQKMLSLYVKMPKISPFENLGYYILGKSNYSDDETGHIRMSKGGTNFTGGTYEKYRASEDAIRYHENGSKSLIKGRFYLKNSFSLANLYYLNNEKDKAFSILEKLKKSKDKEVVSYAYFNEGTFNLKAKEYDKAISSFEKINENVFIKKNKYIADAYKLKGDIVKANEFYVKDLEFNIFDKKPNIQNKYYFTQDINYIYDESYDLKVRGEKYYGNTKETEFIYDDKEVIENFKNNIIADEFRGNIKGKFTFNDANMSGSMIIINQTGGGFGNENRGPIKVFGIDSYAYVDENGEFEFNNIPEGKYSIQLIIPKSKVIESSMQVRFYERDIIVKRGESINVELNEKTLKENIYRYKDTEKYNAKVENNKINLIKDENGEIEIVTDHFLEHNLLLKDEINLYTMFELEHFDNLLNTEYYKRSQINVSEESDYSVAHYLDNYMTWKVDFIVDYPDEVKNYMELNLYDKVLEYYQKRYEEDSKNEFTLQMLIKLYTTGTERLNSKDVNKAIKLADELYKINQDENLDLQVRNFIRKNYLEEFS